MKFLSQRLLFIVLALVFVFAALYVYSNFVKPEYQVISNLRGQLAGKADSLARYQTSFLKLGDMLEGQDITQLKESVSRILPISADDAYVSAQVVGFARLNNLSVVSLSNSIEPIQATNSSVIKSLGVLETSVSLRGSYGDMRSFLQQLENNLLLMDVRSFSAQAAKQQEDSSLLEYALTIVSYYQAP